MAGTRTRKEYGPTDLFLDMRSQPLGWFFVAVWAAVCVLLAVVIMAVTVLA